MPERSVPVVNPLGIHARAAARFVKTASRYDAVVTVTKDGTTIDGKSILGLLFLAASQGSRITIHTSGRQADEALLALTRLLAGGAGDPMPAGGVGDPAPDSGAGPA